jgi:hypothetical protein
MENLLCFRCLENLPAPHIERLHTSKFIVNSPLLVLNISLQKLFEFYCPGEEAHFSGETSSAGFQAEPSGPRPDLLARNRPLFRAGNRRAAEWIRPEVWSRRTWRRSIRPRVRRR